MNPWLLIAIIAGICLFWFVTVVATTRLVILTIIKMAERLLKNYLEFMEEDGAELD